MSEDKKNPLVKEKSQDSCATQSSQSCNKEDKTEKERTALAEQAKKNPAQNNTAHKHGGSCSH